MVHKVEAYQRLVNQMVVRGIPPTASNTARAANVTPGTARRMTRKARLTTPSECYLIEQDYRQAVIRARQSDTKFGVVTYEMVARERNVSVRGVKSFFRRHPRLKEAWSVCGPCEAKVERCKVAAARVRERNPGKKLHARQVACELGMQEQKFYAYLWNRPDLIEDLGITYTHRRRKK